MKKIVAFGSAATLVFAMAAPAQAQSSQAVMAESLFREATALFEAGKTAEACAKFDESHRLDPAVGTLYNLAQCREKEGRLASAWSHYSDLAGRAAQAGQTEREKKMRARLAELEPKVPRVSLKVEQRFDITEIKVDGQPLGRAAWSSALPLDPGEHVIVFGGVDKMPAEKRITLKAGEKLTVEAPTLQDVHHKSTQPVIPASAVVRDEKRGQRVAGFVVGGVGIAAVGTGLVFGTIALGQKSDADTLYDKRDPAFKDKEDAAGTSALISTIAVGVGVVAIAVGAYLVVSARSEKPRSALYVTPGGLGGSF